MVNILTINMAKFQTIYGQNDRNFKEIWPQNIIYTISCLFWPCEYDHRQWWTFRCQWSMPNSYENWSWRNIRAFVMVRVLLPKFDLTLFQCKIGVTLDNLFMWLSHYLNPPYIICYHTDRRKFQRREIREENLRGSTWPLTSKSNHESTHVVYNVSYTCKCNSKTTSSKRSAGP